MARLRRLAPLRCHGHGRGRSRVLLGVGVPDVGVRGPAWGSWSCSAWASWSSARIGTVVVLVVSMICVGVMLVLYRITLRLPGKLYHAQPK